MRKGGPIMFFSQMLGIAADWQDKVWRAVDNILVPILVIACSVGMVWAIVVGIRMIKADEKGKRDEAKANLINIAISIVATAILIGLFYAIRAWLSTEGNNISGSSFGDLWSNVGNSLNLVKQCVSLVVFKC